MIRGGTRGWRTPGEIQRDKGKSMEDLWKFSEMQKYKNIQRN
jgi:hypothetical protein